MAVNHKENAENQQINLLQSSRFGETDGRKRYFVAFTDGQGNFRETEVTKAAYMESCHFIKRERNLRKSDELAQTERIIAKLEQAHQGQQDMMKGLSEVKKTLLNFNTLVYKKILALP